MPTLPETAQRIAPSFSYVRVMPRTRAKYLILGSIIALIGYVLPWSSITFTPPGGSMVLNGIAIYPFYVARNGVQQADFEASLGNTIDVAAIHAITVSIIILFVIGTAIYTLTIFWPNIRTNKIVKWAHGGFHLLAIFTFIYNFFNNVRGGNIVIAASLVNQMGGQQNVEKMMQ